MKKTLILLVVLISLNSFSQIYTDMSYRVPFKSYEGFTPTTNIEIGYTKSYYSFGVGFGNAYLLQVTNPQIDKSQYIEPKVTIIANPNKMNLLCYGGYKIYGKLPIKQGMMTLGIGVSIPIIKHISITPMLVRADMNDYLSIGVRCSF